MNKLMAIFAHPDDEGAIGGTLAQYAGSGTEVTLVCATKGEVGEISDPALATPETLGAVREKELQAACQALGIQQLRFLEHRDSGMEGSEENEDPRALVNAVSEQVVSELVTLIQHERPDVVVTFEPFGWYGHPDHQAVSRWVTEAFGLVIDGRGDSTAAPVWKPKKLFHAVIPFSKWRGMIQEATDAGSIEAQLPEGDFPEERLLETESKITHVLDVKEYFDLKHKANMMHRTQISAESIFRRIPKETMLKVSGSEYFIQVYPPPDEDASAFPSQDLFDDL